MAMPFNHLGNQVVSHIGSGSRIGRMRLEAWTGNGPAVTREMMQGVWGVFDSLGPERMLRRAFR